MNNVYEALREKLRVLVSEHGLAHEVVAVRAKTLSPGEAIGNPEHGDYPILKGKERMMAARFRGAEGHAFTDMFGNWEGVISDIIEMEPANNFRRAIFIAGLNAVTRFLGITDRTVHCRDGDPKQCASGLVERINSYGAPERVYLVGLQPRMLEALVESFEVRVTDMDHGNVGTERAGVRIEGPDATARNIQWCDTALVTGTTVVNGTIGQFIGLGKPTLFYGVSVSGAADLLGLERYCPCGR